VKSKYINKANSITPDMHPIQQELYFQGQSKVVTCSMTEDETYMVAECQGMWPGVDLGFVVSRAKYLHCGPPPLLPELLFTSSLWSPFSLIPWVAAPVAHLSTHHSNDSAHLLKIYLSSIVGKTMHNLGLHNNAKLINLLIY
jgi:hypothetical protein